MYDINDLNDLLFEQNTLSTNDVLLSPRQGIVISRKDIKINSTFIYSSPMDTVISPELTEKLIETNQAAVSCRFYTNSHRLSELLKYKNNENYWFSVGASKSEFNLLKDFIKKNKLVSVNVSVDVAHGDTVQLCKIYKLYSSQSWCSRLMSGTVATAESANNVFKAGCTHIRVGIGPGSACSTRVVTGFGIPNLSAIYSIWSFFYRDSSYTEKPIIIADGGIKNSGDIAKYLSAGADAVMLGNMLSKTLESAGWKKSWLKYFVYIISFGKYFKYTHLYKRYRGQASKRFQVERRGSVSGTPEGVEGPKQHPQYTYMNLFNNLSSGLKSSVSYAGLNNLKNLNPKTVRFIKITENGLKESKPHI